MDKIYEYEQYAIIFKSLSDTNRLKIIELLKNGEKCACDLLGEMNISQSTLSHHMKLLCETGLINCRKEGKWMYYSLSQRGFTIVINIIKNIIQTSVLLNINTTCDCE
jgi:ArsR family transcriptional regulator, arsenate/arsenite/antimonite-responsive transcriptional repressor